MKWQRLGALASVDEFRALLRRLELHLPVDDRILSAAEASPMAQPLRVGSVTVANRWCIHPMEGWDGTPEGQPSEHTYRRWRQFGLSGAGLIWGGEAFAVLPEGRANPLQLCDRPGNEASLRALLDGLLAAHRDRFGDTSGLLTGLQLTHSGRFSRPDRKDQPAPRILYHHPLLDPRVGIRPDDDSALLSDGDIRSIIEAYVTSARRAQRCGFGFVDVKACHGYLGHEFLSAFTRPGPYGGDFDGRTRFFKETIAAIRSECPGLMIGVRLSIFDQPPFHPDPLHHEPGKLGAGLPDNVPPGDYCGFGCQRDNPLELDLSEPVRLLKLLRDELHVELVNLSCGSPYYNPHIQRPALYPPSDGYQPPEDPLVGCVRQIDVVRQLKELVPGLPIVGTAYSYLQEFLPQVAQAVVRAGWVDAVGVGRLVLSYPDLPADTLAGRPLRTKHICRTFSDCTTAPRNGIVSGCYPLDDYYRKQPEAEALKAAKQRLRDQLTELGEDR